MILLKLLLAHLLGDFFLQPTSWVESKEEKKNQIPLVLFPFGSSLSYTVSFNLGFKLLEFDFGPCD